MPTENCIKSLFQMLFYPFCHILPHYETSEGINGIPGFLRGSP